MNPPTPTTVTSSTRKVTTYTLDGRDILQMLFKTLPPDSEAEVTFRVPGGGDWSNSTIEIDAECPITVTVTEKTNS